MEFMGSLHYLSRFAPHLTKVAEPLRLLLTEDVNVEWEASQEASWTAVKDVIQRACTVSVLRFNDLGLDVTVQCDAPEGGLGDALLQAGRPVAYASRAVSLTERAYAQTEKECLAIHFVCVCFNQYLNGRDVMTVHTDHKPLVPILRKPLLTA